MEDKINVIIEKRTFNCGLFRPLSVDTKNRILDLELVIIQAKFAYYEGAKFCIDPIFEDFEYDAIEQEYVGLCKKINKEPWAKEMVGFKRTPFTELCANLVLCTKDSEFRFNGSPMLDHPKSKVKLIP